MKRLWQSIRRRLRGESQPMPAATTRDVIGDVPVIRYGEPPAVDWRRLAEKQHVERIRPPDVRA